MRRFVERNGSHGHLPQVLLSCQTGCPPFDAFHTELRPRATNIRSGNGHGNLGDRYGRVSSTTPLAIGEQSTNLIFYSQYHARHAEVWGVDLSLIQPSS